MQLKVYEKNGEIIYYSGLKEIKPIVSQASKWVRLDIKSMKTIDAPQTTTGIKIVDNGKTMCGSLTHNAMGFFNNGGNSPCHNSDMVALFSTAYMNGHGLSIIPENFMKVCALFTARKTINSTWVNQKDEYSSPNIVKVSLLWGLV